jgi:hypothetical protein
MTRPETFHFSVVRLVPHPLRDEAINLGIVLVSESGQFADYRFRKGYRRKLRALAPDVRPELVERFLDDFEARFLRVEDQLRLGSEPMATVKETLDQLADQHAYQIRFSPPRPVLTEEPARALEALFEELVAAIPQARRTVVDRASIKRTVVRALRSWDVAVELLVEKPQIPVRHGFNSLELAVRRAAQDGLALAVEPISFSNPVQDEVVRQRDHVAWVASDIIEETGPLPICAVLGEPISHNRDLFEESMELLLDVRVTPIEATDVLPLRGLLERAGVEGLTRS